MAEEAAQAIASRDAMIRELHQRLEVPAADEKKREEDILHQRESQQKTLSQQLESAKVTANVAEESHLREMQILTERAQAELHDKDRQTQEAMFAAMRQIAESLNEALRAQLASNHEALTIIKRDLEVRVADSYRTIEGLMESPKVQNLAAEQRA